MLTISEFQTKDVVNVADGKRLGTITDLDINLTTGKIDAIIIQTSSRVLGLFGNDAEVIISWNNIVKIGADVILVRYLGTSYTAEDVDRGEVQQLPLPRNY